jgi:hypothetical protein
MGAFRPLYLPSLHVEDRLPSLKQTIGGCGHLALA